MKSEIKNPTAVDWARLAAFIDGEGCISIRTRPSKVKGKRLHFARITVVNTDARMLTWIKRTFRLGSVYLVRNAKAKSNWKPCYRWEVVGKSARIVLNGCLEYFIIKREQAEVAMQFQSKVGIYHLGPGTEVPEDARVIREGQKNKLHILKKENNLPEVVNG